MKPRYRHECTKCIFCGSYKPPRGFGYDIWYCAGGDCLHYNPRGDYPEGQIFDKGIMLARESNDGCPAWDLHSSTPHKEAGEFWWEVYQVVIAHLEMLDDPSVSPAHKVKVPRNENPTSPDG